MQRLSEASVSKTPGHLVGGLVWQDAWGNPFEGALTLLWKIAAANCLTPSELCHALFGMRLLPNSAAGMHGRTLLVPRWMENAPAASVLGRLVRHSGLDKTSPKWAHFLASDAHIRYCKACLAQGYQSVYCQIEGLRACPVHGLPLLNICTACGAPTPRYALTSASMAAPYCCPSCGEPFADRLWSPVLHETPQRRSRPRGSYRRLGKWLSELERHNLFWPQFQSWQPGKEVQLEAGRRIEAFEVLGRIIPLWLAGPGKIQARGTRWVRSFPAVRPDAPLQFKTHDLPTDIDAKLNVYRAIRRHIRRSLMRSHRNCLRTAAKALHLDQDTELLYPDSSICPLVFAYYIWRHHFESDMALNPRLTADSHALSIRDEAISWPVDLDVSARTWAMFAMSSFFAFAEVAREWHDQVEALAETNGKLSFTALMQCLTDFRVALSPKYLVWSARITYLREKPFGPGVTEKIILVGVPGQVRAMIREHTCCNRARSRGDSYDQQDGFS